jgi:hypothetical protein
VQAVALSIPVSLLSLPATTNVVGVELLSQRQRRTVIGRNGEISSTGDFVTIDRMGNPLINTALIPFAGKDEYDAADSIDDAGGKFAADIVGTLRALGTNDTNIGILSNIAIVRGDLFDSASKANSDREAAVMPAPVFRRAKTAG